MKTVKFSFFLPVEICFEGGCVERLGQILEARGYRNGVLVCDSFFQKNGMADEVIALSGGRLVRAFSEIRPNPTVENVDACAQVMREVGADFAVAMGGGSTMDCAKAACAICRTGDSIRDYHTGGKPLDPQKGIDLIAVPTTAGTGSEVTWVAVLSDEEKKLKAPLGNKMLLPKLALIDYRLTLGIPRPVTASTGVDVLSHALEGFWSVNHQPICDATALQAARTVFEYLPRAYEDGRDEKAREEMSKASLLAGLAFGHPLTTGSHACSFPLTNRYHVPHGEACAFTLDYFARLNAECENGRLHGFARACGFPDAYAMADRIAELKRALGLRTTLRELGIPEADIPSLSEASMHPNMRNNPVKMDVAMVEGMYRSLL